MTRPMIAERTPLAPLLARWASNRLRHAAATIGHYRVLAWPMVVGLITRVFVIGAAHPECSPVQQAKDATDCFRLAGDALYLRTQGHNLAKGHGFINPVALTFGLERPGAYHPPLFPSIIAAFDKVGLRSVLAERLGLALIGVAGVALIGVVAWRIGGRYGRATGVIAATIAALCPLVWLNETQAMSESIYAPLVVAIIGAAYLLWREPIRRNAILLGLLVGLAWLTRAEAIGTYVVVVAPLLWGLHHLSRVDRLKLMGWAVVTSVAVVTPWILYNSNRFPNSTLMTTSTGDALVYRLCDPAFEGDLLGYYSMTCDPKPNLTTQDESAQDVRSRQIAMTYLSDHLGRFPVVVAARVGREWELYRPTQNAQLSAYLDNRGNAESYLALGSFYLLLLPALYGGVALRRRRIPISPLVGQLVLVTLVSAVTSAIVRYRVAGDLALIILAAVGLGELWVRHLSERAARRWQGFIATAPPTVRPAARAATSTTRTSRPTTTLAAVGTAAMLSAATLGPLPPAVIRSGTPTGATARAPMATPSTSTTTTSRPTAADLSPVLAGDPVPEGCELSSDLLHLYDAYDGHAALEPAQRLSRYATPLVQRHLDAVVASNGDLLRIPEAERIAIMRDLARFTADPCNVFGTQR